MNKFILLSLSALTLFSCAGGAGKSEVVENTVAEATKQGSITLTQEQIELAEIKAGVMQTASLSNSIVLNGVVATPPNGTVHISLPYSGIVKKILVAPNAAVNVGQPLIELIGNDFIMLQENYISAKAAVSVAQKEYERQQQLIKDEATTSKILEQAKADFTNTKGREAAAVASLESVGLSVSSLADGNVVSSVVIKAPLSGIVNMENLNVGANIESGARLLTIISKSTLQLQLAAYEKDLKSIKVKDSVDFKIVGEGTYTRRGVITSIGSVVNPETRVINVVMDIKGNLTGLAVGMYAVAKVNDGGVQMHVMPETGVIAAGSKKYIYAKEGTNFTPYEVITGVEDNGLIEIKNYDQLPAGAEFVTYGAYYIKTLQEEAE